VKEASILPAIDGWLAGLFEADQIDDTCAALEATMGPDPSEEARLSAARRRIRECDTKLARYRSALEAGTDPSIVNGWIEEVKLERRAAELELRRKTGENHLTSEEIRSLIEQLKGIVGVLANASAESRREVYQQLNVAIEYHADGRMRVTAGPGACTNECVGGATCTPTAFRCPIRRRREPQRSGEPRQSVACPLNGRASPRLWNRSMTRRHRNRRVGARPE
jgi:site-specific DNA recombinase